MRSILFFTLVLLTAMAAAAQNEHSVSGKATYAGEPVEGALVTLTRMGESEPKYKSVSQADGTFGFPAAAGKYVLKATARHDGNEISAVMEALVIPGGHEELELRLVQPGILRETVNISADAEQPIEQVSKSINIISAQEMRDRADISAVDSLRTIPGFRVQQLGGFGRTATIKTRGLRNQDTAVLLDGVRLRDASAITGDASPFLGDLSLTSISRIEVLRGSGSSLYGTNAVGGTIDLITPEPQGGLHGQISAAFGGLGFGRFRVNLSDALDSGKFGYNVALSRTAYTKGIDGEDNAHNTNFQSKINYRPWPNGSLSARLFISDAYVRLNNDPDALESNPGIREARAGANFIPDANDPDAFQRSKFFNGQVVFTQALGTGIVFQTYYSGLKTSRKNDEGPQADGVFGSSSTSLFGGTIQTANAHLEWLHDMSRFTGGYEFEHERFGNDGLTPDGAGNFRTRATQSSQTIYAQDVLSLFGGNLQIAGGVRWQRYSLDDPMFSLANAPYADQSAGAPPAALTFDGAVSYFVSTSRTKFRAHFGNGYRVPSLFERFGTFYSTFGTPAFIALGDPSLKPEKTAAFDGAIEQYVFGEKAKVTATYFYTRLINTIGYANVVPPVGTTPRPFGGYLNQKGGIARGLELSGSVRPTRSTDIFASYTHTNSDQRSEQIIGSGVIETLGIPKNQFTAVITQRFGRFWTTVDLLAASAYLAPIFNGSAFTTQVYRFKGNRRADLTAGYTFPLRREGMNLRLFGTIENLSGDDYYENGFRTTPRNGRVAISLGF